MPCTCIDIRFPPFIFPDTQDIKLRSNHSVNPSPPAPCYAPKQIGPFHRHSMLALFAALIRIPVCTIVVTIIAQAQTPSHIHKSQHHSHLSEPMLASRPLSKPTTTRHRPRSRRLVVTLVRMIRQREVRCSIHWIDTSHP